MSHRKHKLFKARDFLRLSVRNFDLHLERIYLFIYWKTYRIDLLQLTLRPQDNYLWLTLLIEH